MATPQIRLKTENFRAIGTANIIIDGITVVAGENSSGKSTLSKLLYYLFKTASNYDLLVQREFYESMENTYRFLDIASNEVAYFTENRELRDEIYKDLRYIRKRGAVAENSIELYLDRLLEVMEKLSKTFSDLAIIQQKKNEILHPRIKRLRAIAQDIVGVENFSLEENVLPFEKIKEFIDGKYKEALGKIKNRPNTLFLKSLKDTFSGRELPKTFEVYEFDDEIVSINKNNIGIPYSIQNAIYIDTPMMVGISSFQNEHWRDLNQLLERRGVLSFTELSNIISREIISGDVSLITDNTSPLDNFSFKRSDGSTYNLLDCATGVKSFAILQLLLKNGSINKKTLLIIDEPESHLHPQWIIEYARLIVLLNKHADIKFFIASHNPDMVSAIKYISAKENIENKLNFYIAERRGNSYLYDYKSLGTDVEPIFASFNIAIDRINQYGI